MNTPFSMALLGKCRGRTATSFDIVDFITSNKSSWLASERNLPSFGTPSIDIPVIPCYTDFGSSVYYPPTLLPPVC